MATAVCCSAFDDFNDDEKKFFELFFEFKNGEDALNAAFIQDYLNRPENIGILDKWQTYLQKEIFENICGEDNDEYDKYLNKMTLDMISPRILEHYHLPIEKIIFNFDKLDVLISNIRGAMLDLTEKINPYCLNPKNKIYYSAAILDTGFSCTLGVYLAGEAEINKIKVKYDNELEELEDRYKYQREQITDKVKLKALEQDYKANRAKIVAQKQNDIHIISASINSAKYENRVQRDAQKKVYDECMTFYKEFENEVTRLCEDFNNSQNKGELTIFVGSETSNQPKAFSANLIDNLPNRDYYIHFKGRTVGIFEDKIRCASKINFDDVWFEACKKFPFEYINEPTIDEELITN